MPYLVTIPGNYEPLIFVQYFLVKVINHHTKVQEFCVFTGSLAQT